MHVCSGPREGSGRSFGASGSDDLMTGADQLGNDGRSHESGRAGDEYAHVNTSLSCGLESDRREAIQLKGRHSPSPSCSLK
jgi:hypothetical protein